MIVCSCNVLSDQQIAAVILADSYPPRISQVYANLGCKARCGQCAPTIKRIREHVQRNPTPR
jgi:bacterioferritin-associated ferredoxin